MLQTSVIETYIYIYIIFVLKRESYIGSVVQMLHVQIIIHQYFDRRSFFQYSSHFLREKREDYESSYCRTIHG